MRELELNVENVDDLQAEVNRIMEAHPVEINLTQVYDVVNLIQSIDEMFPDFMDEINQVIMDMTMAYTELQKGKPYGYGIEVQTSNTLHNMYIREEADRKRIANIIARSEKLCDKILGKENKGHGREREVLTLYKNALNQIANGDYAKLVKADHMYPLAVKSTFLTLPTNMFYIGYEDEKGKPIYAMDHDRYRKLMRDYPFIDQLSSRQSFMSNDYLYYQEKKAKGTLTDEDVKNFKYAYRAFLDEQKRLFKKIKAMSLTDKNIADNRTVISNKSFEMNWKNERFGDPVFKNIELVERMIENGWPEDDIGFIIQVERIHRNLQGIATSKTKHKKEDKERALAVLTLIDRPFNDLMNKKITTPEERMEILNRLEPGIKEYLVSAKVLDGDMDAWRIHKDDVIKDIFEEVKSRRVIPSEVGQTPLVSEHEYIDSMTSEARAQRIKDIYTGLLTMEERLDYIYKLESYRRYLDTDGGGIDPLEDQAYNEMREAFIDTYLRKGDEHSRKRVLVELGRMLGELNIETYKEFNQFKNSLPPEETKKEKKAYYLCRMASNAGASLAGLNDVSTNLLYFFNKRTLAKELREKIVLTDTTTALDIANLAGLKEGEGMEEFFNTNEIKRDTNMKAYLRNIHKNASEEFLIDQVANLLSNAVTIKYRHIGFQEVCNRAGYNTEEIVEIKKVATLNSTELGGANIDDWKAANKKMIMALNKGSISRMKYVLFDDYYKDYPAKKAQLEASKARKALTSEEAYPYLFVKGEDGNFDNQSAVTPEQVKDLMYDGQLYYIEPESRTLAKLDKLVEADRFSKVYMDSIAANRTPTVNSIFTLWVLGTYPDVDIMDINNFENDPKLLEAFRTFCIDNPASNPGTKEKMESSIENWANVFKKATDRMKTFTIPEGDYSDPEFLRKSMMIQIKLRDMTIDFSQQKDKMFKGGFGVFGKELAAKKLGEKSYNEMLDFWSGMQNLFAPMEEGFIKKVNPQNNDSVGLIMDELCKKAVCRALTVNMMKQASGKSIADALEALEAKRHYMTFLASDFAGLYDDGEPKPEYAGLVNFTRKDIVDYLNDKNKAGFEKKIAELTAKLDHRFRKDRIEEECRDAGSVLRSDISFGDAKNILLNLPDTAEAIKNFVNSEQPLMGVAFQEAGIKPEQWLTFSLKHLFSENYSQFINAAGMKKMDVILVDGKSPKKVWGEKYGNLDSAMREKCYQAEVLKALIKGDRSISVKTFAIDKEGHMKVSGTCAISKSAAELRELKKDYEVFKLGLSKITDTLKGYQNVLLTTHDNKDPNVARQEIGQVGSDLYKSMESTLDAAIKALERSTSTTEVIESKLKEFKQASANYYKERKSIFQKRHEEGRNRITVAENASKEMPNIMMVYDDLTRPLKSDVMVKLSYTFEKANISQMKSFFEESPYAVKYNDTYNVKDFTVNDATKNNLYDAAYDVAKEKVKAANEIIKGLSNMGKTTEGLVKKDKRVKADPYDMAIALFVDDYMNRMNEVADPNGALELADEIKQNFDNGTIKKEAEKLSKNVIFKELIKTNRTTFTKEWKDIQKRTDATIANMRDILGSMSTEEKDVSKYIMTGIPEGGAAIPKGPEALKKQYDRLGDFVAMQILTDPANRLIVQAIEAGRLDFKEVVSSTTKNLEKNRVLEGRDFNLGTLRDSITSGNLKRTATESVMKDTSRKAKEYNPAVHREAPNRVR